MIQPLKRTALRSADCDEAASTAFRTRDAVIRRRKEGAGCGFSFRGIRDMRQRIAVRKPSGAFVARNLDLAEPMPDEAWQKLTTIVPERGGGSSALRSTSPRWGRTNSRSVQSCPSTPACGPS